MSRLLRIVLTVILAPFSLGLLISGCSPTDATVVGREAPSFELPNADGEFVSLSAFKGSPILINFWYTGCPPCRTEIPYLHQVYSEMERNGLVILAINVGDSSGTVRQFLENNNLATFINTVLFDSNGATVKQYSVQWYPTSFFIDRDGIIREKVIGGFQSKEAIEKRLDSIIS